MMWFKVEKELAEVPATGTYRTWKPQLRIEGRRQCVYCAIGEPQFGGVRNFHVEHYRPKKHFSELSNVFGNLFYCCSICNSFKSDDWPCDPESDLSNSAYPDPSEVDYSHFLSVDDVGIVSSGVVSGRYLIERLNLNRVQLQMTRRFVALRDQISELMDEIHAAIERCEDIDAVRDGYLCARDAWNMLDAFTRAIPYEPEHARR